MPDFADDALGILKAVAPAIATAIGGPLAGLAVSALGNALGRPGAEPSELSQTLTSAAPDDLLKLKQADNDFAAKLRQLDIDEIRVDAGDRADARARQVALHDATPAILAYTLTAGFFGLIGVLCYHALPPQNAQLINILLGSLGTAWIGAMTYFFGSTKGSRDKDTLLAGSMPAGALERALASIQLPGLGGVLQAPPPPPAPTVAQEPEPPPSAPRMGTLVALGDRNNNPLNLTALPGQPANGRFRVFDTMEDGVCAAAKQMQINQTRHDCQTIRQQVSRWAPPSENDTASYLDAVAHLTGFDIDAPFDTSIKANLEILISAMAHVELGHALDPAVVSRGVSNL